MRSGLHTLTPARMSPPPVLTRVAWVMTAMLAASVIFTAVFTHLLHTPEPFGIPWFWHGQQWPDFRVFQDQSLHFRTPAYWDDYGYPFTYPAPLAVTFGLFYRMPHPLKTYFIVLALGCTAWTIWLTRGLIISGLAMRESLAFALIILLTSWPVWYLIDTTNIEGLMAILLALGVLAVLRGNSWLGAVLIGIAASMKLFPIILLVLLISKKRFREFGAGVITAVGTTVLSLDLLGPSIGAAQAHLSDGMEFLRKNYMVLNRGAIELNFSHSLFNQLKFALLLGDRILNHGGAAASRTHEQAILDAALPTYLVVGAILGIAIYLIQIRTMPLLNQTIALTVAAVLLPPFSSDYTLIHLLIPFALLCFYTVDTAREGRNVAGLNICFACFCLVLAFESFFTIRYAFANSIRTLALCVMLVAVLRNPFPWQRIDGSLAGVSA